MKPIRILIADDHSLMRFGLSSLIASEAGMSVVGEAEDGEAAVALARKVNPDVIIMDLMMPRKNGAEATRLIHEFLPDAKILILTSYGSSDELIQAVANGARGALLKDTAMDDLITAIRKVAAGKKSFPVHLQEFLSSETPPAELTDRQKDILTSVTRGLTNCDIAKQFGISEIGVKKHLSAIFEKLGVANRSEAVALALRKHLLDI